jgi:GNAT superfamily N-acetyltransferase
MIFFYSNILKNFLKKKYQKYDIITYNYFFNIYIKKISSMIKEYADTINEKFIDKLLESKNIEIVFYQNNSEFNIKKCIGFIIYTKTKSNIYLLLFCIQKAYRKFGYGKIFSEEFINYIENLKKNLITHPIDSSIEFYKSIGFTQIFDKIYNYKKIFQFEKYNKNAKIFELKLI